MKTTYFIGWDVGAWNCKPSRSQDSIVILDSKKNELGKGVWLNLKDIILGIKGSIEFIKAIFKLCQIDSVNEFDLSNSEFILSIDAPFGFPAGLKNLFDGKINQLNIGAKSIENSILYRDAEHFVKCKKIKKDKTHSLKPLSSIQDSIGSQTTKIHYFLKKINAKQNELGIWSSDNLTMIETYPSAVDFGKVLSPKLF